jgi:signal peptide peptidase SppA
MKGKNQKLKRNIYLISERSEQEITDLEDKLFALQGDAKALEAYTQTYGNETGEEREKPYQVHDGIAIIELKGPLVARTTWMSKWLGAMSYEDLRAIFVEAVSDPEVDRILIDADTPGGQVNGLGELSSLMKMVGKIKPIDTYVAGGLLSAGYWLGSVTGNIYASETAFVGSIGVVVTHTSYQGALEKAGIKVTKIKSGEKKQVGSSEKDLSASEQAYLQAQVDDLFTLFKRHVLSNRAQVNPDTFDGSEYLADKALAMGLVDRVMTFDDVLAHIINQRESSGGSSIMAKKGLTTEQVAAAAASGAKLEDLGLAGGDMESNTSAGTAEELAAAEAAALETAEATAAETVEAEASNKTTNPETVSAYLESQLAKANDKISDLTVENRELKTKATQVDEVMPKLKTIVSEAINRMQVALGMARVDMETMETSALIKQYEATSVTFSETFKPGGLLNQNSGEQTKARAKVTNIDEARNASVGL